MIAALLEMHRQPPFLGASRGGLRLPRVNLYEATLRGGSGSPRVGDWRCSGPKAFPSSGEMGREALKALTGVAPPDGLDLEPSWIVEELRWLSEAEFDAGLARVVEATGGVHWSAWEARRAGAPRVEGAPHHPGPQSSGRQVRLGAAGRRRTYLRVLALGRTLTPLSGRAGLRASAGCEIMGFGRERRLLGRGHPTPRRKT